MLIVVDLVVKYGVLIVYIMEVMVIVKTYSNWLVH